MNGSISPRLLQALMTAPAHRRTAALQVLEGKAPPAAPGGGISSPHFLSMTDSAKYAGVSRTTLYQLVRSGRLTPVELLPGFRRIRRSDIEALAESRSAS